MRARLRRADELLREGRVAEAVAQYEGIADEFERGGFSVKAIAVSQKIVEITSHTGPETIDLRAAALQRLVRLYTALHLPLDATAAAQLLAASRARLN